MKRFHLIANPVAGKKKSEKNIEIAKNTLIASGAAVEIYRSKCVGDATRIARELTEAGETELIALGGDGTLHEVLNGLVNPEKCTLGLIPSGTGNDFAEHAGLPLDAKKAAQTILEGNALPTDYLDVGGVRCMNVAGMGIDVDVLARCRKGKLKGKVKYLLSLIQSLFSFKGIQVEIENGGETETRDVLIAAACNGSQFGGGIKICPTANSTDGKLGAVIVDCIGGKLKIIQAFLQLMKGKILEYPLTKHFLCERLRFSPKVPCTLQLDGELYTGIDFDVQVKQGLKFYR